MSKEKIILGIDPGTNLMGYGLIKVTGSKIEMIQMGEIDLKKYDDHMLKIQRIFIRTLELIDGYHPDEFAIEAQFFGKNVQSMLKLGRAQGAAISAALYRNLPVVEYAPKKIKQSITGNGNASKEQVAKMLQSMFKIKTLPKNLDATDGLATALCHHYQNGKPATLSGKNYTGWDAYVKQNPSKSIKR